MVDVVRERLAIPRPSVLDVGCGAGFLANPLARLGWEVTGLDASAESLAVAARHDPTGTVRWVEGDALALPFEDGSFDVACAMDFLEHVDDPAAVIREAARVVRPGGLFFFHTFNRTFLAWLVVVKGVEWFVKNTPEHLHVKELFVTPEETSRACEASGMTVTDLRGVRPVFASRAFLELLVKGTVADDFAFTFTRSLAVGYAGYATKR
jgi:2-polyprenyl-6-hydroxyphenyl methylase/3-demethylubiquinone-9 3-methyltransferase